MNEAARGLLKEARKKAKLKQSEVAEKMSVKNSTISNWETGISEPDIDSFVEYCKICGADYAALMTVAYGDPTVKTYSMECTIEEMELVRKFRLLDKRGQRVVTRNLISEYEDAQAGK